MREGGDCARDRWKVAGECGEDRSLRGSLNGERGGYIALCWIQRRSGVSDDAHASSRYNFWCLRHYWFENLPGTPDRGFLGGRKQECGAIFRREFARCVRYIVPRFWELASSGGNRSDFRLAPSLECGKGIELASKGCDCRGIDAGKREPSPRGVEPFRRGCGFGRRSFSRKERSGEGAGVCARGAGSRSEGGLGMATFPRSSKVKIATLRKARRVGHPRSSSSVRSQEPGRFGVYGGRYVPETLMAALDELEREYERARKDKKFQARLEELLRTYAGRPTPLFFARRLTEKLGGAKIYLKREDLLHTGAHKINNCLGQGLLVERMGKHRVIAETGAGQHGVATVTVCALLGFECVVYMGTEDMRRQELNVFRMRLLGAEVRGVESGSRTLKDAINEAMRDWVTNVRTTHYLLGSVLGAHPYPTMVRDFHRVIGREARVQILKAEGKLPTAIIACVGGGSNSIGIFYDFVKDKKVRLVGVEAGGRGEALGEHAARFRGGSPGVLQGTYSYVLQDSGGQIALTHSVSAGLDYPSIGPEHAALRDEK